MLLCMLPNFDISKYALIRLGYIDNRIISKLFMIRCVPGREGARGHGGQGICQTHPSWRHSIMSLLTYTPTFHHIILTLPSGGEGYLVPGITPRWRMQSRRVFLHSSWAGGRCTMSSPLAENSKTVGSDASANWIRYPWARPLCAAKWLTGWFLANVEKQEYLQPADAAAAR